MTAIFTLFQVACALALLDFSVAQINPPVCDTTSCRTISTIIRENMDTSVDACQDFFQYACGSWIRNNPTPHGLSRYTVLAPYTYQVKEEMYRLLQVPDQPDDSTAIRAAKLQFRNCMNEAGLNAIGLQPLINIVQENGGWPMIVEGQFPLTKSWQEIQDNYNRMTGNGPLYTVLVYQASTDEDRNSIVLDQPWQFPLGGLDTTNAERVTSFVNFIANVAGKFAEATGANIPRERLVEDARQVLVFMDALHQLRNSEEWRLPGPVMSIRDAELAIKNATQESPFNLLQGLQRTFSGIDVTLTEFEVINIRELDYFQGLLALIQQTPITTILNYLQFHFVEHFVSFTTNEMRNYIYEFQHSLAPNRTILCATQPNLEKAVSRLFVKQYVPQNKIDAAQRLLEDLKVVLRSQITRTEFIDPATRTRALAKVDNLISIVGADALFTSDQAIDNYYAEYAMGDSFLQNMLNYNQVQYQKLLRSLRNIVNHDAERRRFKVNPTETSVYYKMRDNRLEVPGSLFRLPLFSLDLTPLSNYAGLGIMIATMLADLYTFFGLGTNETGAAEDWPQPAAGAEFQRRTTCFVEQNNNMTLKELADAGLYFNTSKHAYIPLLANYEIGLKVIYEAHQGKVVSGTAQLLPDLADYTIDKQFFLNFASLQCETVNPQNLLRSLNQKPQTTKRIRVNSALANFPKFAETFNCRPGTPMNPRQKCHWFD